MTGRANILGSISVFFPAFNDQHTIGVLVANALEILPRFTDDYEVLVIDDGSTDGTAALLDSLSQTNSRVRVIRHVENRGYGGALQSGFENATKEFVFYTDGDGQYDVREIARLIPLMTDEVDVVNGYKAKRADSFHRVVIGKIYNRTSRLLFRLPIRDVDCDFRLIRLSALRDLGQIPTSGAACLEIIRKLRAHGALFAEVEVSHYPRLHGHSQFFTFQSLLRTFSQFCGLLVRARLSPTPVLRQRPARKTETVQEPMTSKMLPLED